MSGEPLPTQFGLSEGLGPLPQDTLRQQSFTILSRLQSGTENVVRLDTALAAVAAERERCCRVVAVQRDDDRYDLARRTILAIRAGDDFYGIDDDVLRA